MQDNRIAMRIKRPSVHVFCLAVVTALTGCGGATNPDFRLGTDRSGEQIVPANYRADIVDFLKTYLNDPRGIREAAISQPQSRAMDGRQRYVVCVRYNARNANGTYAGASDRLAIFFEGRFDQLMERAGEYCRDATFAPFPELERLSR
jgi:hypothetical protein